MEGSKKDLIIGIILAAIGLLLCLFMVFEIIIDQEFVVFAAAYCVTFLPFSVYEIFKGVFGA